MKSGTCGRRWGKSESGSRDLASYFLAEPNHFQGLTGPGYKQIDIIWAEIKFLLTQVPGLASKIEWRTDPFPQVRYLPTSGHRGYIYALSMGGDPDDNRGQKFHRVLADERAYIKDDVIANIVKPWLADYNGQLIQQGTPAGRGAFYQDFMRGLDPRFQARYFSLQLPSELNPYLSREYLENEKATQPSRTWQQEYMAMFLSDAGGVFRAVEVAIDFGRTENEMPVPGHQYVVGWDLARTNDWSVFFVLDMTEGRQVYFDRMQLMSWERQAVNVASVCATYNNATLIMDSTGPGDPVYEMVRRMGVYVQPYLFSNASKERLIDNAAMLIENARVRLMDIPVQEKELSIFEYTKTPSGLLKMAAPPGEHDDCVIACALALWGMAQNGSWFFDRQTRDWLLSDRPELLLPAG